MCQFTVGMLQERLDLDFAWRVFGNLNSLKLDIIIWSNDKVDRRIIKCERVPLLFLFIVPVFR